MTRESRIERFEATTFAHGGRSHQVFCAGSGPAVVVVHEVPGIHPGVLHFARRLIAAGYRVYPWLRALAARAHAECGGPGVGAVGRCMTGDSRWRWRSTRPSSPR